MSPQEFEELYAKASAHRRTERTLLNEKSSRSHAVLSIHVCTEEVEEGGKSELKLAVKGITLV